MKRLRRIFLPCVGVAVAVAVAGLAYGQVPPTGTTGPGVLINAVATGTTGTVTATLAAAAGKITYICGFNVSAIGATTATTVAITVGVLAGNVTQTYQNTVPITGASTVAQTFAPCIPGNALNTAISVSEAANANGTAIDVNAWGYQR